MHRRSARLALLAAAAILFVAGPTLSQPRVAPQPRKGPEGRVDPSPRIPDVPGARPVSKAPTTAAPASPTAPTPEAATPAAASPAATPGDIATACASGTDLIYTQPASMAPVTNRSTCRHQGRSCCEETRDWCLSEGFIWQNCKNCYCGAQCMGPSLVD